MFDKSELQKIKEILESCANFQNTERRNLGSFNYKEKGLNQLVSHVDIESEQVLVSSLLEVTPDATFLTEEETISQQDSTKRWIIDPLDGTTNYLFGHEQFAISIAYQFNNKTVYGGIFLPANGDYYFSNGKGSFLNDKSLQSSSRDTLSESLIATGFPYYDFKEIQEYLGVLHDLMKSTKGLRRMGSAAIDLAYTAEGRFDGFFELNLSPWDVAAGALIVSEARGTVTDFSGGDDFIFGRSILASNTEIHEALLQVIHENLSKNDLPAK